MNTAVNILYVDDNEGDHILLEIAFERYIADRKIIIHEAEDVTAAIKLLSHKNYDGILIDWNLPDGCGKEVAEFIRRSNTTVPIVFFTASLSIAHQSEVAALNVSGCIEKNFDEETINVLHKYFIN